jgi:predicted transcriptional regulator
MALITWLSPYGKGSRLIRRGTRRCNMVQYDLAKEIQQREGSVKPMELVRATGLSKDSVDAQLQKLVRKGYVQEEGSSGEYYSDVPDKDLDRLKPVRINELEDEI